MTRAADDQGGGTDTRPGSEDFRLAPTPMAPRLARQRVGEACAGLDDEQRAVAVLLTSELVSNAVRHPPRDAAGHETEIEVRIQRTDRAFRVEVCDHDARPLPQVLRPVTPREGGMGLHIVHELADAWGDHLGPPGEGKVVWFEIRLPDAD